MLQDSNIGVYFSANDVVYDWAIAFLNSYRTFNPDLRLILIPFKEDCNRLLKLQGTYNFEIYNDPSFERLEEIGKAFELGHTLTGPYWFRRYAAFWGPCDRFMYLDARQVVLTDLTPIIQALNTHEFELLHFDCAINQVYESGELRRTLLRKGKAKGFNSGRWASLRGLFSLEEFERLASNALQVRTQLNPRNTDQAFFNYCCDINNIIYGHVGEVFDEYCKTVWARQPGHIYCLNDKYFLWDYGSNEHKKQIPLLHWAGYSWRSYMPNRRLLFSFLSQRNNALSSYIIACKFWIEMIPDAIKKTLAAHRRFSTLYRFLKHHFLKHYSRRSY